MTFRSKAQGVESENDGCVRQSSLEEWWSSLSDEYFKPADSQRLRIYGCLTPYGLMFLLFIYFILLPYCMNSVSACFNINPTFRFCVIEQWILQSVSVLSVGSICWLFSSEDKLFDFSPEVALQQSVSFLCEWSSRLLGAMQWPDRC